MSQLIQNQNLSELCLSQTDALNYLLIDGVKMEPVLKWVYQHIENPEWYPLYKNTRYQDVIDLSPCLVKVPPDSDIANQFDSKLGSEGEAIWLQSSNNIETLGPHLSRLLWITTEDGRYLHYRFYDPASLSRLAPALTPEESAKLYNGVESIIWFNAQQRIWQKLAMPHSDIPLTHSGATLTPSVGIMFKSKWMDATLASP
ncbi:DUF4123 domain-containing protein [Alkalimarinus coralli]|uniref:DUF4123 domain-containing protein n=1 Tax=Alkalimarinus coralli TaxID=2935863 RepID=UPI00202B2DB1|nr:DUF4123 domain-containing protein [Alkalimarinus coralli]